MTKKERLAYIAGIIDGEGHIGIKKTRVRSDCTTPSYHVRIHLRMVNEEAIKFIAETLGGWYYKEKPHAKKGRPLYCYQASDKAAAQILRSLLPYLLVKREAAENALALRELQENSRQYRTKVTGYRDFPNMYGKVRRVPNLSYSDEYIEMCHTLYERSKEINKTGA